MSREDDIRNATARRRNLLFLTQRFLADHGFYQSAEALKNEARLPADEYELCDNIDLDAIYLEYASYYHLKFGKYPKIVRKLKPSVKLELDAKRKSKTKSSPTATTNAAHGEVPPSEPLPAPALAPGDLELTIKRVEILKATANCAEGGGTTNHAAVLSGVVAEENRNEALTRLQQIEHSASADGLLSQQDWHNLADLVKTAIMRDDLKLSWADMCGNASAVEIIKEAVVTPLKYPQLFVNGLRPWKSVLLHGPPGSGKTLLAKILYAETRQQVTFFNVTSSVVVSKWRGESEKIMRILFHMAHKHAPSIIFFDEIEGLTSCRDRPSDHESSKRFKNELLQLLDGMEQQMGGVFVLASSNLPWEIDDAFLRRFEKKLLVQLPNPVERAILIGKQLPIMLAVSKEEMELLVRISEHFTGDEIRLACKEIAMQMVRRVTHASKRDAKAEPDVPLQRAFEQIKPLSVKLMKRHQLWQQEHGS
ncbi:PREDICTED: katanin p60 ATPase-containing subunit A-like 2 [Rhagoletis zephyria]|uniref:katanin p60 ATPase-containing subunit A-like 2 n=1 Tax=Rhagoletis zephyria TaxID=28612 RepID=UPI0008113311|nr:PREDICTED: katanin p60 ATPase-containing subunit A-like 2 [Rhagoletis zephyria]